MRPNPMYVSDDPEVVRALISEHPWGTLVSVKDGRLVASHYPILLDDCDHELAIVTHVGKPDDQVHGFGDDEMLLIVQGRHGYISPSWYGPGASRVPTWNFSVAHCHGVPQLLDAETNVRVLARLVEHFERHVEHPVLLDADTAQRMAPGTVGIRLPITRFEVKLKLSQDKDRVSRRQVLEALRRPGRYHHPALADDMDRVTRS